MCTNRKVCCARRNLDTGEVLVSESFLSVANIMSAIKMVHQWCWYWLPAYSGSSFLVPGVVVGEFPRDFEKSWFVSHLSFVLLWWCWIQRRLWWPAHIPTAVLFLTGSVPILFLIPAVLRHKSAGRLCRRIFFCHLWIEPQSGWLVP